MDRTFAALGALLGFLGVAFGAFGAHALRSVLTPGDLAIFETGVRYQLIHALALFAVAAASVRWPQGAAGMAGWLFVAGVVLFSGSLYALTLTGYRGLGAVTPLGGLCFLAGWAALGWTALRG